MMHALIRRIGGYAVSMLITLILLPGCSIGFCEQPSALTAIPPTNSEVARNVLSEAFAEVPLPAGGNRLLSVRCTGDSTVTEMAFDTAVMAFTGSGYRITRDMDRYPRITVRVESLVVTIAETVSPWMRKKFKRTAAVNLLMEFEEHAASAQVFQAAAVARDDIPAELIETIPTGQPYVVRDRTEHPMQRYAKPFTLAILMTVLTWTLYSYRG